MSEMDIVNNNNELSSSSTTTQPLLIPFKYTLNVNNVINKVYLSYDDNILLINEFLTILNNPEIQIIFPNMNTWDFNIYEYDANHMILLTIKIFINYIKFH